MIKLIWTGETRILPNMGTKADGDIFEAEEVIASSLIQQGLAAAYEEPSEPPAKTKKNKGE